MTTEPSTVRSFADLLKCSATVVWILLISATALSWALGTHHGIVDDPTAASLIILAIAFIKIRFIGLYFMDLKDAPLALRALIEAWCLIVFCLTAAFYLAG
ncbi:cytochrome C oxidase subunit IV family protein [Mycolicibacterium hodleri]|uniref:cytochrome C oxidase subunit IV family protein n=1 Tax=Mycolicibacterium hodleri TaxID=49897 RepID=UPI00137579E6|nr:cytochrome C oxidase subunit IV family protein [Mycolicibacterium hodleri]